MIVIITIHLFLSPSLTPVLSCAHHTAVIGRRSITQPGEYLFTVLPCDVWEDGMMTLERYGRHGNYALRKFWQRNGLDKLLAGRGGGFTLRVVARHTIIAGREVGQDEGLGIYSSATIKTTIKYIDDDQAALFLEQKFDTGGQFSAEAAAVSFVKVRVIAPSDPTLILPKEVCNGRTSDLVRHVLSARLTKPRKVSEWEESEGSAVKQARKCVAGIVYASSSSAAAGASIINHFCKLLFYLSACSSESIHHQGRGGKPHKVKAEEQNRAAALAAVERSMPAGSLPSSPAIAMGKPVKGWS